MFHLLLYHLVAILWCIKGSVIIECVNVTYVGSESVSSAV